MIHRLLILLLSCGLSLQGDVRTLRYEGVVPMALERNLGLKISGLDVPLAEAELDEARAARNPTLTNNFFYIHQDSSLVLQNLPNTRFILLAAGQTLTQSTLYTLGQNEMLNRTTLSIPIYTGGRLESNIHLRQALAEAARHGEERARQQLALQAKEQFLATLLAGENRQVAEQTLVRALEIERDAQSHLDAGVGTRLDVLQAEGAVADARDAATRTKASWQKAEADLASLLDLPVLTEFDLPDRLGDLLDAEKVPPGEGMQLIERALNARPELRQLRAQIVANRERENVARADELPQLGLNLNYDTIGNPANLGSGPSLAAVLTIPLWDGGVADARIEQIKVRDLQLKTEEARQVKTIEVDVRQAVLALEEADSRLTSSAAARASAAEALHVAGLRYQVGAGTSLELVTAQTVLANSDFGLADAHYRQMLARARLNAALGSPVHE